MAEFTVNATRVDPYKNFKFRVKWDGEYVAGRQQGKRAQADHRGRQAPRRRRPEHEPQVTRPDRVRADHARARRDPRHEFEQWANKVWDYKNAQAQNADQEVSLKDFRKDIIIDVFNEAGQKVISYHVFRCWVSEYQSLPDLDANANAVAIQHLKLENEGWDRDPTVVEPTEPSFDGYERLTEAADGPDRRDACSGLGGRSRRGSARPRAVAAALARSDRRATSGAS